VTDANGKLYEHVAYFPFGETWVREHSNTLRTPYLFTGKELDAETGLYYFGARYYDPRTSVWASVDPIIEEYLSGKRNDGVFNSRNLAFYGYAYQNPIRLVDPDGNNPGPITVPGMFPMVDYRSGNAVVDNTALGAVNTVINVANSLGNIAARGLGALGEALPDPGVIQSAGMAVHPTLGMGVGAAARGLVTLARMDKAAGATVAAAKGETTVVGRVKDLQNLKQGEKSLLDRLPDQGSPKANWKQNSGVLRQEMGKGEPIRDASPGDTAGQFLNAERNLLTDRGWTFDSKTNNWNPPAQ
jgi:RHS repeat-associated protein